MRSDCCGGVSQSGPVLRRGFGLARLIEAPLQEVPLAEFSQLRDSEFSQLRDSHIPCIDSSHALKIGTDVHYTSCRFSPAFARASSCTSNDIFLPAEYPHEPS